ncbi:prepilin peptidase [Klebsiella pneumoniae]|uniref:HoxN/HupN/NixA family nickel/cobalt transporter n=1 Tax=Klebsiella pneumoniae TaxID=573 RepID=UPI0039692BB7
MIMTVLRQQPRAAGLVLGLIAANFLAWCWALQAFGDSGALMAASLLAWGYGLRHAVDADHIAAIDNVTRKMMQQGRRPFAVGAWFSLGHSSIVLLWAGLLFNLNEVYIALPDAVAGAMAGYLALWSVYWLFRLLTGKEALGYGDFKLLAALGAWCGWQVLPQVLLLASASGLVWTLLQRLWTRQSLQQPLAFGPWLALAGGGIFLWQQMI